MSRLLGLKSEYLASGSASKAAQAEFGADMAAAEEVGLDWGRLYGCDCCFCGWVLREIDVRRARSGWS